jgi:hypothetical protein
MLEVDYGIDLAQMTALGPTKISVLLLYRRIFGIKGRRFNTLSMLLLVVVTAWTITFFLTNTFQYTPVTDMWTKPPALAHDTYKYSTRMFLAQAYAGVALDALIIALPAPLGMFELPL